MQNPFTIDPDTDISLETPVADDSDPSSDAFPAYLQLFSAIGQAIEGISRPRIVEEGAYNMNLDQLKVAFTDSTLGLDFRIQACERFSEIWKEHVGESQSKADEVIAELCKTAGVDNPLEAEAKKALVVDNDLFPFV